MERPYFTPSSPENPARYYAVSKTYKELVGEVCEHFQLERETFGNAGLGVGFSINGVRKGKKSGTISVFLHGVDTRVILPDDYSDAVLIDEDD